MRKRTKTDTQVGDNRKTSVVWLGRGSWGHQGVSSPKGPHHRALHWLAGRKAESCWGQQGAAQPWALRGGLHCTREKETQYLCVF